MDEFEAISALRALGEPTRWKVMRLLAGKPHGMAAGDIAEARFRCGRIRCRRISRRSRDAA